MIAANPEAPIPLGLVDVQPQRAAEALGMTFMSTGFAVVTDHGISPQLIADANAAMRAFFALPDATKRRYQVGQGGARGFTPFGTEIARQEVLPDRKEFWHVGRSLAPGHRYEAMMPRNVWPDEIVGFERSVGALYQALDSAGRRVLRALALFLMLPADFFDGPTGDGNSILRLLHYPPVPVGATGIRSAAHEDINVITLLLGAEEAGLQLCDRSGHWRDIGVPNGALVCNIGDMLQRLTNHRLPSTTHRVVNPPPERASVARYSAPFFLHFAPDYLIQTLPGCIDSTHPDRYPKAIAANDFLLQRLHEIGLL